MKSTCDFDILSFPNNLQLEIKNSIIPSCEKYSNQINQNLNKKYKIKNKIQTDPNEKSPSSAMTVKILKNVKYAQERVFLESYNSGMTFVQNQSILEKIKLTSNLQTIPKILEYNEEVGKFHHHSQVKNLIPGMKRK
jgi:Tfp pilus assembly protein PilF